jgi:hypothetical protein
VIDGAKSDSCREESEQTGATEEMDVPRRTGRKGTEESEHHEQSVEGHETRMSGFPRIGFVDVDGPIGRWSGSMMQKDLGFVELDKRCHIHMMAVAMTVLIAITGVQEWCGVTDPYPLS